MIADVTLNQMRVMFKGGSTLLRFEKDNKIFLYYVTQAPVILRTILQRPESNMEYLFLVMSLPPNIEVLNVVEDHFLPAITLEAIQEINMKLDEILKKDFPETKTIRETKDILAKIR